MSSRSNLMFTFAQLTQIASFSSWLIVDIFKILDRIEWDKLYKTRCVLVEDIFQDTYNFSNNYLYDFRYFAILVFIS